MEFNTFMGKRLKQDSELRSRYRAIKINGKSIDEHRYIMETVIGRPLHINEIVHHKDGNKLNNDPDNLEILDRADHARLHNMGSFLASMWINGKLEKIKRQVVSFDSATGKLETVYESFSAAIRDGHVRSSVRKCLNGHLKKHHNKLWRYADASGIPEAIKRGYL